jgi:hypothetical protein
MPLNGYWERERSVGNMYREIQEMKVTPRSTIVLFERITDTRLLQELPSFHENQRFIDVFRRPHHWFLS